MYELKPVETTPEAIAEAATLLQGVWPGNPRFSPAYLKWLYADNPAGKVVGFNAYEGQTLAAHYVTVPLVARLAGVERRGLLSLNTATHPEHQGKKLFTRLAEATYARAAQEGYSFVTGVANANSTPGFTKKLGFQLVSPLDARVGLAPTWDDARSGMPCLERTWSSAALEWRLVSCPAASYLHRARDGRVEVASPTAYPGIRALLARLDDGAAQEVGRRLPRAGPSLWLWLGLDARMSASKARLVPVPSRLRPSPLCLIYRSLDGAVAALERETVRFHAIDFDAY